MARPRCGHGRKNRNGNLCITYLHRDWVRRWNANNQRRLALCIRAFDRGRSYRRTCRQCPGDDDRCRCDDARNFDWVRRECFGRLLDCLSGGSILRPRQYRRHRSSRERRSRITYLTLLGQTSSKREHFQRIRIVERNRLDANGKHPNYPDGHQYLCRLGRRKR